MFLICKYEIIMIHIITLLGDYCFITLLIRVASCENLLFAYAKTNAQISCNVTVQLISIFVLFYITSTIPLLPKSEISSLKPSSVVVQPGLCQIWSETPKISFLMKQLKYFFRWFTNKEILLPLLQLTIQSSLQLGRT